MPIVSRAGVSAKVKVILFTAEHLLTAATDVHSLPEKNAQLSNTHIVTVTYAHTQSPMLEPTTVSYYASDGK